MSTNEPTEPTPEECSDQIEWTLENGMRRMALWYPQMGGYTGKCVVEFHPSGTPECFEAWVWHDGEFPFGEGKSPAHLHHCSPEQFVSFGEAIGAAMDQGEANR